MSKLQGKENSAMNYEGIYRSKLTDKSTAMDLVKSNDRIMVYGGANVFLESLCERSEQLENVELYTMFMLNQDYPFLRGQTEGHITHCTAENQAYVYVCSVYPHGQRGLFHHGLQFLRPRRRH